MERSWYWRLALVVGVALFSVYQLVPSWFYFKLPPDQRNSDAYEQSVPRWAPDAEKHLNLGLDLQGGIHLALGVDVDRAVKAKVARRADEIAEYLRSKEIPFADCRPAGDGRRIAVKGPDLDKIRATILDGYDAEMYAPGGSPEGAVAFAFKDQVLRDFQTKAIEQAEKVIRNRVDGWGVKEPDIKRKAGSQIQIQLPGFKDPQKAKELLGRTAQLEFKIADDENPALDPLRTAVPQCPADRAGPLLPLPDGGCWMADSVQLPNGGSRAATVLAANTRPELERLAREKADPLLDPMKNVVGIGEHVVGGQGAAFQARYYVSYLLRAKTELTGDYLAGADVARDDSDPMRRGQPVVTFKMTPEGGRLMEKLTTENMGRRMATVLEEKVETAPYIRGRISTNGQITLGSGTDPQRMVQEASEIAQVLRSGALPAPVTISEERTVGATLGPELVRKGAVAALVGLAAVLVFMILYYRASGLIADLALVLNGLLVLAIMATIGSTLTLPGIAGFVLTLGMAVDANVLINERIREEMRAGQPVKRAVQQGYDRVFWTIVDSHVTTLVAAIVLMNYGSGPVRGFAVTLTIGLLASMFTSIVVTRVIMEYFTRRDTARLSV
ncbi:MAG TPA: protein translocase subunit SecD [Anaeromyxobacter sp.]|nr:protein translocase subunit SecD [Anaeromyxobacter sp.]